MNKKILKLTFPNIITNITVPLLGIVDLIIAGSLGNEKYIGAIAIGTAIFNLIYWNFGFLRMGTTGLTAQTYGAKNRKESLYIIIRGLVIACCVGTLMILFQEILFKASSSVLNVSDNIYSLALSYFHIRIWAAPFTLSMYVFKGWFIGMQNATIPMIIAIFINIVNISLSLIFVRKFNMGIEGIALGTLLAQISGVILAFFIWLIKYRYLLDYIKLNEVFQGDELKRFFTVNRDIFIRTTCLIVVFTFFTSMSSKYGDMSLAVNTIVMQSFSLFSYIMDGFAFAAEAIIGKYYGAKNYKNLKIAVTLFIRYGFAFALIFAGLYAIWLPDILSIITDSKELVYEVEKLKIWIVLIPIAGFLAFIYDGVLIGLTASVLMRNSMIISTIFFFILFYALEFAGVESALWGAFLVYLSMRGLIQFYYSNKLL